jgi:hypothetical protein
VAKVRHFVEHYHRTFFVVNAAAHFGLARTRPTIILILRDSPVALLADRIENMTEISGVLPLPAAFAGDERPMVSRPGVRSEAHRAGSESVWIPDRG